MDVLGKVQTRRIKIRIDHIFPAENILQKIIKYVGSLQAVTIDYSRHSNVQFEQKKLIWPNCVPRTKGENINKYLEEI